MTAARTLTQAELVAEARAAFGDDPEKWAFRCPSCGDVAVAKDFRDVGADTGSLGQDCIGRHAIGDRGCNFAAYGFFPAPWTIRMPDGAEVRGFPLAVG